MNVLLYVPPPVDMGDGFPPRKICVITGNGQSYDVVNGVAVVPQELAEELIAHHPLYAGCQFEPVPPEPEAA